MWQSRSYFSSIILVVVALFSSRSAEALDIYQTLKEDAKKLRPPQSVTGPDFEKISTLKSDDEILGIDPNALKTPELKQDFAKLLNELHGPEWDALMRAAAVSENIDEVITDAVDASDKDPQDDDESESVERFGIISALRSNVHTNTVSLNRAHIKQTIAFPIFQAKMWEEMRAEKTLVVPTVGRDYLADRSMTEFCTEDAGIGLPGSSQLQFSIFDIGIAEASGSSLDLALLHLLEQPDAFRIVATVDEEHGDDALESEVTWQRVLTDWQTALKSSKRKLTDISFWWKKENPDSTPGDASYAFTTALAEIAKRWSVQCLKTGGRWIENQSLRKTRGEWTLAACQTLSGAPLFRIYTDDSVVSNASSFFITLRQGALIATIQSQVPQDTDGTFQFYFAKADEARISALLTFDEMGHMRQRIGPKSALSHAAWNAKGRLIWSGRQGSDGHWVEDISWDETGKPRTEFFFDPAGNIQSIVEWYADFKPASVSHFASGHREGLQQWWHENGRLAGDSMWSYGKRLGTSRIQFDQGIVGFDASYVDNQMDGTMIWRDETSNEVMRARFNHGLVEGSISLKSDAKTELAFAKFDHGLAEGEVRFGQPGLQPTVTFPFKSGILDGVATFYTVKHAVRMQVPFRSGKLEGELKAFYSDGSKAATCKFDTSRLLTWNSWPKHKEINAIRIEGRVNDVTTTRMTQTIFDDAKKISANCEGREGVWNQCIFNVKGKTFNISEDDLQKASSRVNDNGSAYNMKKCGGAALLWNLRPWIETGSISAFVELVPATGCRDMISVICKVAFTDRLQVSDCNQIDVDSEDEDGHDHNE